MRKTTSTPPLMPSPRPRPRTSPEDARQLASATGDLGFTRPSNPPEAAPARPKPSVNPESPKTRNTKDPVAREIRAMEASAPEPSPEAAPKALAKPLAKAPPKASSLKFEVPDEVWFALRQEALNRRVTVRYLVLEALAAKGYGIDLSTVPEDGRRLR